MTNYTTYQLLFFDGCPNVIPVRRILTELGINFTEINQSELRIGDPLRSLSSPSVLFNDKILLGATTDGANACSFEDFSYERLKKIFLNEEGK